MTCDDFDEMAEKIRNVVQKEKRMYAMKMMRLGREKLRECDHYERMATTAEQKRMVQERRRLIQQKMTEAQRYL